jgi:hypothetical protein
MHLNLSKRKLLDVSVCAALLYAAVWIYELGNYVALSALGSQATIAFSGILPIGVSASVLNSSLLMLAKPAQIALSTSAMLGLFFLVRSMRLQLSSSLTIMTISIYLASAYWELLSSVGSISYGTHLAIFFALAMGAQVGLSAIFKT